MDKKLDTIDEELQDQFDCVGISNLSDAIQPNNDPSFQKFKVITDVLNKLNIDASVTNFTVGPSFTRFIIETRNVDSFKKIEEELDLISIRLGGVNIRFVPQVKYVNSCGIEISNNELVSIPISKSLHSIPAGLKFPIGVDVDFNTVSVDLNDVTNILVAGAWNTGKTMFLRSAIFSLIMKHDPDRVKIAIICLGQDEMKCFNRAPHMYSPVISNDDKALDFINDLLNVAKERLELFDNNNCRNFREYNKVVGIEKTLSRIVVFIDDFAEISHKNPDIFDKLVRLAQVSKCVGIHLCLATQHASEKVVPGMLKAYFDCRIALRTESSAESCNILNKKGAEKLDMNGDMLIDCRCLSNSEKLRLKGFYIDTETIVRKI